jgi:arylsulfatase B
MPGTIPQGIVEKRAVVTVDIAATCLAASGASVDNSLDGVNVIPFFTGENRNNLHDRIYWRMGGSKTALRVGDWKIVRPAAREAFELYHLAVDAAEKENLASEHPARLSELVHAWMAMDSEMEPPIVLQTAK